MKSFSFGANLIFEITSPIKSKWNFKLKFLVSHTVIVFAFDEILAKYFPLGENARLK